MSLKKGTPGTGGQGRADSFSYTRVGAGLKSTFGAFLAGEPYWCLAHEHTAALPGTKPCLQWMTDGALSCPRCRPHTCPTWVGYVPLYREADHAPILVIVHEAAMDLLSGLSYPAHVLVGRVEDNASVFVKRSDSRLSFRTDNEQRKRPRDVTCDLLNMWKLPQLETWLMEQRRCEPKQALKSDGRPFDAMHAAAAQKYHTDGDGPKKGDADYDAVMERLKNNAEALKPSTNGEHKPK